MIGIYDVEFKNEKGTGNGIGAFLAELNNAGEIQDFMKNNGLMQIWAVDPRDQTPCAYYYEEFLKDEYTDIIVYLSDYFKMAKVCELADVKYSRFREWKSGRKYYSLSLDEMRAILKVMKKLTDFEV